MIRRRKHRVIQTSAATVVSESLDIRAVPLYAVVDLKLVRNQEYGCALRNSV